MKIHHLNCGSMHPPFTEGGIVCHVMLIEGPHGLVLVDSGIGLKDCADPGRRFGDGRHLMRPAFDRAQAAITQVRALGFAAEDVRDVVLTHFDADHTGGLADFPWARVHLTAAEAFATMHPHTRLDRQRYLLAQREHGPELIEHTPAQGESWRGFAGAQELTDVAPDLVLVSLPGHTAGHAAVAVRSEHGWILHAGDSFYRRGQIDGSDSEVPLTLRATERLVAHDWRRVQANHLRLRELWEQHDPDLQIVNAHDPGMLASMQAGER